MNALERITEYRPSNNGLGANSKEKDEDEL